MQINFGKLLQQIAKTYPEKVALFNVERKRGFTFRELHLLTNKICNMIRDRFGLQSGEVYSCLLKNDNFSLFSYWTAKGEATKLWLNYRDSFDEHMYQIDHVVPKLIFLENETLNKYYEALRSREIKIICMDKQEVVLEGVEYFWDLIDKASDHEPEVEFDIDEHIVDYRFTGGTTGKGKCCMYTVRNYLSGVYQLFSHPEHIFDENTRFLHMTPITHGSGTFTLPVYFKGGTQYTINNADLNLFCEIIQNERITATTLVPTVLYRLLELSLEQQYDLSSLKTLVYAASPMNPDKLEILQEKFGNIFMQAYGASEAFPQILLLGKADHTIKTDADRKKLSSCGKALVGVEARIADKNGNEAPTGSLGEVWIRSNAVIKGYYKNVEETAKAFSQDHFWKSGDIGYMDEKGYIYLVDRLKDMIVSGGFNVYCNEVENVLSSHPAVLEVVVVGIPHSEWGEAVHAEVILRENMQSTEEDLINHCKATLAKYKVPKSIKFVTEVPISVAGKVLRRMVKEKYWINQARNVN